MLPIYPTPEPPKTEPTPEQEAKNLELKHSDNEIFGDNLEQIADWRNEQKENQLVIAQQQIVAIVENFYECATTKLGKLQQ